MHIFELAACRVHTPVVHDPPWRAARDDEREPSGPWRRPLQDEASAHERLCCKSVQYVIVREIVTADLSKTSQQTYLCVKVWIGHGFGTKSWSLSRCRTTVASATANGGRRFQFDHAMFMARHYAALSFMCGLLAQRGTKHCAASKAILV